MAQHQRRTISNVTPRSSEVSGSSIPGISPPRDLARMERCSHDSCPWPPKFNVEGSKMAAFCKQHAEDGMVNIFNRRCSHDAPVCAKTPMYNVEGSKTGAYCRQHARAGMVVVDRRRCLHGPCQISECFNFQGKRPVYCKEHADYGMVNVRGRPGRRCSDASCMRHPSYSLEGSKRPVYCKQHAEDGMVNAYKRRCSHDSCTTKPSFNVEGTKPAVYCKQHAQDGMVDVVIKRCSHDSCTSRASWGRPAGGMATVCSGHKNDILGDHAIFFRAACRVDGCGKHARWGLDGKQPTHCPHHGPLQDGLVCTVRPTRSKSDFRSTPYRAVRSPSFRVRTECLF